MVTLAHPTSSHIIRHSLLTSFPASEKKEREKEGKWRFLGFRERSFFTLEPWRTRLDPFQGYTGSLAKPHDLEVHDGDGARSLPRA
jgi:hypothetical protein